MENKESQSQQGSQKQNGSRNQRSDSQDRDAKWKNKDDDSKIENPGKLREDDENNTSKKIPQMRHHDK
jgi:hypothetical protein